MSMRPVDVMTMLPRLTEASRLQHNAEIRPAVAQHAAALAGAEKAMHDQQSVHQRPPTERAEIHHEGQGSQGDEAGQRKGQRKKKETARADAGPSDPQKGHRLDVRL